MRKTGNNSANEFDLVRWICGQVGGSPLVPIGIGDDCAGLQIPDGLTTLVTTDMVIDGVHFRMDEIIPSQVGHKAVARALSDIAAMAGEALAVVVAIAAPKHLSISWLQEMVRGMIAATNALNVQLIGGDIASGDLPLTVTVTCIGAVEPGEEVRRSSARAADVLLVTGELGGSLVERHLKFLPRLEEAQWLRHAAPLHAMIDISDGLAADANHIAVESGVAIELWEEAIPISPDASILARRSGKAPLQHALFDGEDYELLFTVGARDAARLLQRTDLPVRITCIGEATAGSGLWLRRRGEERRPLAPGGWVHNL